MAFLLDTHVVSELRRPRLDGGVVVWIERVDDAVLDLASVTIGEIQAGMELTRDKDSAKADGIERWLDQVCNTFNILTMDGPAFRRWAQLMPPPDRHPLRRRDDRRHRQGESAHGGHPQRGRLQPI